LHLLAVVAHEERQKSGDTLQAILAAPDREELIDWLRHRPLLFHDPALECYMLHAGLPPQWSMEQAASLAREVEACLQSDNYKDFFHHMYGNKPDQWHAELGGWDRLRFITNCFTRLRYCDQAGRLALKLKAAPGSQPEHLIPWFRVPGRQSSTAKIFFGHWSTLGVIAENNVISLDCGCVWGGSLVAHCVETGEFHTVQCAGSLVPGEL